VTALRVLIPVNGLERAKGRLAEMLSPEQRAELALAPLETVLAAVDEAGCEAFVLTADGRVAEAVAGSARALREREDVAGLNAQLEAAMAELNGDELLILHADLPLTTARDIRAVLAAAADAPSVTIVESPDGGTNAMLLRPPGRFALAYGRASASLHRAAAQASGMTVVAAVATGLELDLDTPADLERLLTTDTGRASAAGRLLSGWGVGRNIEDTKKG
jgi:2-phospho-L-lactate guanylyltransferase